MSTDVFAGDKPAVSVLDTLVGEGKKFDNVEALAQGKAKSDEHIVTLEQENADLKSKLDSTTTTEETTATIQDLIEAVKTTQAPNPEGSEGAKTMSAEELEEIVRTIVSGDKDADTKALNRRAGNELVLKQVDGNVEAARAFVADRATALGMSPAALAELSETSPTAFAALVVPSESTASSGSLSQLPSINTDALLGETRAMEIDGFKTKAWFDAKKKEVGHVKYINDQSIQVELTRSMNGLGERFSN
jgi:hypothetical protein